MGEKLDGGRKDENEYRMKLGWFCAPESSCGRLGLQLWASMDKLRSSLCLKNIHLKAKSSRKDQEQAKEATDYFG
jgi:hypothetical protein